MKSARCGDVFRVYIAGKERGGEVVYVCLWRIEGSERGLSDFRRCRRPYTRRRRISEGMREGSREPSALG